MDSIRLKAVRGAVCAENTEESIRMNIAELIREVFIRNKIQEQDIVSLQFTVTPDLTAINPAAALRKEGFCSAVPLFCAAEPVVDNGLPRVIRMLITWYTAQRSVYHVYLNGAEQLRPDIAAARK